ncbi:MAG: hypothetical protein CR982_05420 [Candidatus Cloacimonadota bacterium]|nr:MAG: hypothetical protein CR982_05420 [Candidatus Cloacimonadota bacterium]PIE77593.1 MAG: hypothetical protein CSA15_12205 [Candidatus Delongbacteria bacterium]
MRKILFVPFLVLLFLSCETTTVEDAKIAVSTEEFKTMLIVDIINPYTDKNITTDTVEDLTNIKLTLASDKSVEIDGTSYLHSEIWSDLTYKAKSVYDSELGTFVVALSLNAPDPEENEYDLDLKVDFEGADKMFAPTFKKLKINRSGIYKIDIYGVLLGGAGNNGITCAHNELELQNGITQEEQVLQADDHEGFGSVRLTMPEGTELVDINGSSLSGTITTHVGFFNNQDDESMTKGDGSLNSIPGGFKGKLNGEDVHLILAGTSIVSIVDENNKHADKINSSKSSTQMIMIVPPNTYNPNTQKNIADGDVISIFSLTPGSESWEYVEDQVVFKEEYSEMLFVKFEINNAGYWTAAFNIPDYTPESAKPSIKVNGSLGQQNTQQLDYVFSSPGYLYEFTYETTAGVPFEIPQAIPANLPLNITISEQGSDENIQSKNLPNGVTSETEIVFDDVNLEDHQTWEFIATGICEESQVAIKPSGVPIYYSKYEIYDNENPSLNVLEENKHYAGVTANGTISINGIDRNDTHYRFYVDYENIHEYLDMHFTDSTAAFLDKTEYISNLNVSGTTVEVEVKAPDKICKEF